MPDFIDVLLTFLMWNPYGNFILGYLFGSIPSGLILAKLFGYGDIRNIGSGNIGATNALRTGSKSLAASTLLMDLFKAIVPILFVGVKSFACIDDQNNYFLCEDEYVWFGLITGLGAIIGHCFPIWLKFNGGKGVATTFGVLFAAVPWAGFIAAVTWGIVAGFSRYSSLAALCAIGFTPVVTLIYYGPAPAIITVLVAVLVFWRHKENIKRLTDETEPKIGAKKETDEPAADTE